MHVRVEWGPFMGSCYLAIQEEVGKSRVLHIAGEIIGDIQFLARSLPELAHLHGQIVPIERARLLIPRKDDLQWGPPCGAARSADMN